MVQSSYDYSTRQGIHPISWEDFHGLCKALVRAVSAFQPEIILPIGRGGFYPGTLMAHLLQVENAGGELAEMVFFKLLKILQ